LHDEHNRFSGDNQVGSDSFLVLGGWFGAFITFFH
jgi:hypothetical protein